MNLTEISEKHYKLIGVSSGCNWKELRKAYKIQIQKFHPDRYDDGSILKFDAEEHIKSLNIAYRYFQKHYKEHGELPRPINKTHTESRVFKFNPEDTQDTYYATAPTKKRKLGSIISGLFITGTMIAFLYNAIMSDKENKLKHAQNKIEEQVNSTQINNRELNQSHKTEQYSERKQAIKNSSPFIKKTSTFISDSLFSYGSTMGNVIDAQGIPDKSNNDIWHYGQSKVFFENGLVTKWQIHRDTPLNTTISLKTETYRNNNSN